MLNRQSGAAHVPIMFFLLLLLMFFGALGFGYVQQTNNAELRQSAVDAKAALKEIQDKDVLTRAAESLSTVGAEGRTAEAVTAHVAA